MKDEFIESRIWKSPISHLLKDYLDENAESISMKDREIVEYVILLIENNYLSKHTDMLRAKIVQIAEEVLGEEE